MIPSRPDDEWRAPDPRDRMRRAELERAGRPFLVALDPGGVQHLYELPDSAGVLVIGRATESDVLVDWDALVSRAHARLERRGGEWFVSDSGSRNGTTLNGRRVTRDERLDDLAVIGVGDARLLFRPGPRPEVASTEHAKVRQPPLVVGQRRAVLVALARPALTDGPGVAPASNEAVGREVHAAVDTVKGHLKHLYAQFGVRDLPQNAKRLELVRLAIDTGAIGPDDVVEGVRA